MKKVLSIVAVLAAAALLGVATVNHYTYYKKNAAAIKASQDAAESNKFSEITYHLSTQNAELKAKYNNEVDQCLLGRAAYDKLNEIQKKQSKVPTCGTKVE